MMTMPGDDQLRRTAERRVAAKLSFRIHLLTFVLVNGGLVVLNLVTSPGYLWCLWVVFGWGMGLIAHGYAVYGIANVDRERLIEAELARLRRDQITPPRA